MRSRETLEEEVQAGSGESRKAEEAPKSRRDGRASLRPIEFGRRVLIESTALALLSDDAEKALLARGTPPDLIQALLSAVAVVARLPSARQVYHLNLGSNGSVARYLRARYASKRRAAGALFLDRHFDLLAEDSFDPTAGSAAEGEHLAEAAVSFGATGIIVFRYFRVRRYLPSMEAADFTRHMRDALRHRAPLRFLDYLLVTPEAEESHYKLAAGTWP